MLEQKDIKCLRKWFATFGVPEQLASDGGPEFVADTTSKFLRSWGVSHRLSSAYNPSSNGRAELAVKSVKRLMRKNVGPFGSLDTDRFLKAMLQFRNTPDPDCGVSPAEIVFGRPLRDNLHFTEYLNRAKYSKLWQDAWAAKEEALRARFIRTSEDINRHARYLPPLTAGVKCFVQNQTGQHAKKWHHTGTIMEALPHDKYAVRIDGSGRVTVRNRQFLKEYTPPSLTVPQIAYNPMFPQNLGKERIVNHGVTRNSNSPDLDTPCVESKDPLQSRSVGEEPTPHIDITDPGTSHIPCAEFTDTEPTQPGSMGPFSGGITARPIPSKKLALALRRIQDFNSPGLKE